MEELADSLAGTGERAPALALVGRIEACARGIASQSTIEGCRARLPDACEKIGGILEKLHEPASAKLWYQRSLDAWTALAPPSKEYSARPERVKALIAAVGK